MREGAVSGIERAPAGRLIHRVLGGRSNRLPRRRRENGLAPVFSFEPGRRWNTHDSTSALTMVRPTTITTGPMPELPRYAPSTLATTMPNTRSAYVAATGAVRQRTE